MHLQEIKKKIKAIFFHAVSQELRFIKIRLAKLELQTLLLDYDEPLNVTCLDGFKFRLCQEIVNCEYSSHFTIVVKHHSKERLLSPFWKEKRFKNVPHDLLVQVIVKHGGIQHATCK